ncbi:hypothetical protein BGZ95_000457 [Linnemannia exigua]|uniref:Uncharacterized protein n=1 Tax=Linnemannia exigua TaxID=604196 RepID=A0AAD4D883_9FUNG|nr:hypothetical protein BGZ95_000457 [Linnemannia exigua]
MKLSSSSTTTAKLATLTLTILAALTVLNTAVHAAPLGSEPVANAQVSDAYASAEEAFGIFTDPRRRAEPEETPPKVPIGPGRPLVYRRAGEQLGRPEGEIADGGGGHTKRGESSVGGEGEDKKPKPDMQYKRAEPKHRDPEHRQGGKGGEKKEQKPDVHYKRDDPEDSEHRQGGKGGEKKEQKPDIHYKRADPEPEGEENKKKEGSRWHFK